MFIIEDILSYKTRYLIYNENLNFNDIFWAKSYKLYSLLTEPFIKLTIENKVKTNIGSGV